MSSEVLEIYNALDAQQKRQVDEYIFSIYAAAGKTCMRNSKSDEEVTIAEKAFEELCAMTKRVETKISLNGTEELAYEHRRQYESLDRH